MSWFWLNHIGQDNKIHFIQDTGAYWIIIKYNKNLIGIFKYHDDVNILLKPQDLRAKYVKTCERDNVQSFQAFIVVVVTLNNKL